MNQTSGASANDKSRFEFDGTTTDVPTRRQRATSLSEQERQLRDTMVDIRNGRH